MYTSVHRSGKSQFHSYTLFRSRCRSLCVTLCHLIRTLDALLLLGGEYYTCEVSLCTLGMAYHQTPTRANVEFLKSSAPGVFGGRAIKLNYGPEMPPPQIQGRVDPHLWADFMGQVRAVADRHPYLGKPGSKEYSNWILAGLMGAVVGLFCISPDAGSYPQWEVEVNAMLQHYQPLFNKQGMTLSMQHNREAWIQIDVSAFAQGIPVQY